MSLTQPRPEKKRKHAEAQAADGSASKKLKKDKKDKVKKDRKGKGRARHTEGEFKVVKASLSLSIAPVFANNPLAGAGEMLDSLVMRYVPALQGVLLCHSNARFLSSTAMIKWDCPFANCDVAFDATVWSPQIGMRLTGKVNLCSPDHIALLMHRTFNVSVPRHHIVTDSWEFEYGAAENDPMFGKDAALGQEQAEESGDVGEVAAMLVDGQDASGDAAEGEDDVARHGGRWMHKITGSSLGGSEGFLEFTVIGLTVANQMLSLVGSLQPDPFSPEHVAQPAVLTGTRSAAQPPIEELEEFAEEDDPIEDLDEILDDNDDLDDEDPFGALGRAGDRAQREAAAERAREEAAAAEEKLKSKSKRKKEKDASADGQGKKTKKKRKGEGL